MNLMLIFFVLLICSCSKKVASVQNTTEPMDKKLIEATVINYSSVDGCGFLLELSTTEKLQPENLASEFKKDKLKVFVKYHTTDRMTVCMAGKTVYIDYIKIKKD